MNEPVFQEQSLSVPLQREFMVLSSSRAAAGFDVDFSDEMLPKKLRPLEHSRQYVTKASEVADTDVSVLNTNDMIEQKTKQRTRLIRFLLQVANADCSDAICLEQKQE